MTLDAVLGLAAGSGACMLIQPSVGEVAADVRVVVIEGEIVAVSDRWFSELEADGAGCPARG
jgi:hypothetical protein